LTLTDTFFFHFNISNDSLNRIQVVIPAQWIIQKVTGFIPTFPTNTEMKQVKKYSRNLEILALSSGFEFYHLEYPGILVLGVYLVEFPQWGTPASNFSAEKHKGHHGNCPLL
jgi:hypothetical protein